MPTVPQYNQSVQMQSMPSYRVQGAAPEAAFGGGVGQTISTMGEEAYKEAVKQKNIADTNAVMNASNNMTMDMLNYFNGENGLFSLKGDNAQGCSEKAQQFFTDTFNKYSDSLGNDTQIKAFQQHMKANSYDYLRSAATHERNEAESALKTKYATGVDLNNQGIAANWQDPLSMGSFVNKNSQMVDAYGVNQGWDKDTINLEKTIRNSAGIKAAFTNAMQNENMPAAENILKTFGKYADAQTRSNMDAVLQKVRMQNEEYSTADSIVKQAMRTDNSVDITKAYELLDQLPYAPGATKTVSSINDKYMKLAQAVSQQTGVSADLIYGQWYHETGGFTSQLTKENNNFGGITQTEPNDSPQPDGSNYYMHFNSPEEYAQYYANYVNKYIPGAKDTTNSQEFAHALKSAGYYTADEGSYAAGIQNGIDNAGGNEEQTVSSFNPTKYKAIRQLVEAKINDITKAKNDSDRVYKKDLRKQIFGAGSQAEALAAIDNADDNIIDAEQKQALINSINSKYKREATGMLTDEDKHYIKYERSGGLERDESTLEMLQDKYAAGEELTDAQWKRYKDVKYQYENYQNWLTGGQYGQQQNQQQYEASNAQNEADIWDAIEALAERNASRDEIINKINGVAPKYGFDPSYFIDNTDWSSIGKKQGGVK